MGCPFKLVPFAFAAAVPLGGCAQQSVRATPSSSPASSATATVAEPEQSDAIAEARGAAAPSAPTASPAADQQVASPSTFPPRPFTPPHDRSAQPGDGQWVAVGEPGAIDRASWLRPAALVKTVVHPHKVSRFLSVVIVALDLTRLRIGWVPGADDPKVDEPEPGAVRGLIPDSAHSTALCVMNGGWQPRHGRWGMMRAGVVLVPPRPDGCTVAVHDSGRVSVGPWPEVEPVIGELSAYRQTPPCLLHEGMLHPELERNNERRWGGRNPKRKTRRRSAIGIDASGTVLLFAVGIEVGAKLLAEALRHAGAASAAELDINWYWTRFLLFGNAGSEGAPRVTSKLLPGMEYAASEYVSRPSERDFFYAAIKESAVPGRAAPEQR